MTRKLLLTALVLTVAAATTAQEPTALWGKSLQAAEKRADGQDFRMGTDGALYMMTTASSRETSDDVTFGGQRVAPGTVYRGTNPNSSVTMQCITKLDTDGNPLWTVYSQDAQVSGGLLQPVSDGIVAFLTVKHTEQGGTYSPCLVDASGATFSLNWTLEADNTTRYFKGVLVKISTEGAIQWLRYVNPANTAKDQSFTANGLTADGAGNLWLAGRLQGDLTLEKAGGTTATIALRSDVVDGDILLVKMDKDGYYTGHLLTEGKATNITIAKIGHADGRIYMTGYVESTEENTSVSLGGKTATLSRATVTNWKDTGETYKCFGVFTAAVSSDLSVDYFELYPSSTRGGTMQFSGLNIADGYAYVTGTAAMTLTTQGGTKLTSDNWTRAGFLLQCSTTDGKLVGGHVKSTNQARYFDVFKATDGRLYASVYVLDGNFDIECFDENDLTAPVSTWEKMLSGQMGNAVATVVTADGKLFTSTGARSKCTMYGGTLTTGQTNEEYSNNICAFKLPIRPASTSGIRSITTDTEAAGRSAWYTLGGQRVSKPTAQGIYIHQGRKVVVK